MDESLPFLGLMAFMAGLIDAAVGGGGLIQIPALFNALPHVAPATLFGTNKGGGGVRHAVCRAQLCTPGALAVEAGVASGAGGVCVFFCWRQCGELDPQVGDAPLVAGLVAADGGVHAVEKILARCMRPSASAGARR